MKENTEGTKKSSAFSVESILSTNSSDDIIKPSPIHATTPTQPTSAPMVITGAQAMTPGSSIALPPLMASPAFIHYAQPIPTPSGFDHTTMLFLNSLRPALHHETSPNESASSSGSSPTNYLSWMTLPRHEQSSSSGEKFVVEFSYEILKH
jgi:hypothetical protein